MKYIFFILLCIGLISCKSEETSSTSEESTSELELADTTSTDPVIDKSELIDIDGDQFTEYYPGRKQVKFQGPQDENGQRHGKWLYYSETGLELSMTMYEHGNKEGHIMVKYPNGQMHYTGEFSNNVPVGQWKTYSIEGVLTSEKDYGYPE